MPRKISRKTIATVATPAPATKKTAPPAVPMPVQKEAVTKPSAQSPVQAPKEAAVKPPAPIVNTKTQELIEQLRRGDLASRSAAATALGKIIDGQSTTALIEALRDPTAEVACEAATALGVLTERGALHALIDVVVNHDGYFHSTVRTAACESLGRLDDPRGVEALVAAVRDPILETSLAAIHALGKIGDARAFPTMRAIVANSDGFFLPEAQEAAGKILGGIGA